MTSFDRMMPVELPIFFNSTVATTWPRGSGSTFFCTVMASFHLRYTKCITGLRPLFNSCFTAIRYCFYKSKLLQPLQLGDHSLDHAEASLPESGITSIEAEGGQELGV